MDMPAGKFKAQCLDLMDKVSKTQEEIVITKRGKPVAKLVAVKAAADSQSVFGCLKGTFSYEGDLVGPLSDDDWDAEQGILFHER